MAFVNPLLIQWNVNESGNKVSVLIENESHQVVGNILVLNQIPDEFNGVDITGFSRVKEHEPIVLNNQFKVDFSTGILTFHPSKESQTITIAKYYGRGYILYPSSRIFDDTNGIPLNVSSAKTLADYINSIKASQFKNLYDDETIYEINNVVTYRGSTYISLQDNNVGHLPSDTNYWQVIATGYNNMGDFDYEVSYATRDMVNFGMEKSIYECLSPTSPGQSPLNAPIKWLKRNDMSQMVTLTNNYTNDVTSLYVAHDNDIVITHNLNKYVDCLGVVENPAFGNGGFGLLGYGAENSYQIKTRVEYDNTNPLNKIKVFFDEKFNGTPTITKVDNYNYTITFSGEACTIKIILR